MEGNNVTDIRERLAGLLKDRYTVEGELGQGGMATVFLARDVRHERKVALKVLRPELAAVIGGARFLQEIRTTANLQHPHILPLFDSGEVDSTVFYVMPFIEGESLRERLNREKQLPVDEAVRITREVASALDYAHRHGVVHRDIKPGNILLHDGQALVADFGIALAIVRSEGGARITETGMSLGTPHYMSPEQAMGERQLDGRTDVYSLGCVTYEMLVGEPPFTGPTAQAIIARVVTEDPRSLTTQRRTVPRYIETAVRRALEKLPADRFASAGEFAGALITPGAAEPYASPDVKQTRRAGLFASPSGATSSRAGPLIYVPSALAVAATVAALWGWLRPPPAATPPPVAHLELSFATGSELQDAPGSPIALSPDGRRIVYVGSEPGRRVTQLFSRAMDQLESTAIAGTQGGTRPFLSPDGQWVGFLQNNSLRKVSLSGGAVITVCDKECGTLRGAAWGSDDVIVFGAARGLYRVPAGGGRPELLAAPDTTDTATSYRWPDLLPGDETVVFTIVDSGAARLATLDLRTRRIQRLNQSGFSPHYVATGHLAFVSEGTLFAAPFDARQARFTGPPEPIAERVRFGPAPVAKMGISRTGSIAYMPNPTVPSRELVFTDRNGRTQPLSVPPAWYLHPRFSPDGQRIAVTIQAEGTLRAVTDVWVYVLATGSLTRVTFDSVSGFQEWMPDGRRLAYVRRSQAGLISLFLVNADGSGAPEPLLARPQNISDVEFSVDGRIMVITEGSGPGTRDVWVVPTSAADSARPLLRSPFDERGIALAPDGATLAYVSDETGSPQVYVRRLAPGSPRWRLSVRDGVTPVWARDGRELFFMGGSGDSLYVVDVQPGDEPRFARPRALFSWAGYFGGGIGGAPFDVSRDGTRLIAARNLAATDRSGGELHILLNAFDHLRARR